MLPYWFSIHDNGSVAFAGRTDLHRCSKCGELLSKWSEPLTGLVLRTRKRLDLSCTYDGIRIASAAFKDVYDENRMIGLLFSRLPDDPRYFSVTANIVVPFDWQKRQTRFDDQCPVCGRYKSVAGATPVFLREARSFQRMASLVLTLNLEAAMKRLPCGCAVRRRELFC